MNGQKKNRILLFLGAGASRIVGYHTFYTFSSLLFNNEIRQKEGLKKLQPKSNIILLLREIENSLKVLSKPATHDNFLWALNDYKLLWHNVRIDNVLRSRFLKNTMLWGEYSHFSQLTDDAINEITRTTIHHYSSNKIKNVDKNSTRYNSLKMIFDLYQKCAKANNPTEPFLPVFTTNYDMFFEDLFSEFSFDSRLTFINGIRENHKENSYWDENEFNVLQNCFHYYRLHGSSCLFYHGFHDPKVYYHRTNIGSIPIANLYAIYPGKEKLRGLNPHARGFRNLYEYSIDCDFIVFIGFSFRDDDVKHVILSANSRRKKAIEFIIIDPNLRESDIHQNLIETSERTQFPVSIPDIKNIHCIECSFGEGDFYNKIFSKLSSIGVFV